MYNKQHKIKRNKDRFTKNNNNYFAISNANHDIFLKDNSELSKKIDDSPSSLHHKTLMKKYVNNPENVYIIHTYWNTLWEKYNRTTKLKHNKNTIFFPANDMWITDFYNIWAKDLLVHHNKNNICVCNDIFIKRFHDCEDMFCNNCASNYVKNGVICKNLDCESRIFYKIVMGKYDKYINDINVKVENWIELYKEFEKWKKTKHGVHINKIYERIDSNQIITNIYNNVTDINIIPFKVLINCINGYANRNDKSMLHSLLVNIFKYINDNINKNIHKLMKQYITSSIKNNNLREFILSLDLLHNVLFANYGPIYKQFIELFVEIIRVPEVTKKYHIPHIDSLRILHSLCDTSIDFGKYNYDILEKYIWLSHNKYGINPSDTVIKRIGMCDKNNFSNKLFKMIHIGAKYFNRIICINDVILFGYMLDILGTPYVKRKFKSNKIIIIVKPLPNYLIAKIFSYIMENNNN